MIIFADFYSKGSKRIEHDRKNCHCWYFKKTKIELKKFTFGHFIVVFLLENASSEQVFEIKFSINNNLQNI